MHSVVLNLVMLDVDHEYRCAYHEAIEIYCIRYVAVT
jgi:hypothetical protein